MSLQTRLADLITAVGADIKALRVAQVKSFAQTLSTSATSYVVTHNLGTKDVTVQIYGTADPWRQTWVTVDRTTINSVTLSFATAPTAGSHRVVIQGKAD